MKQRRMKWHVIVASVCASLLVWVVTAQQRKAAACEAAVDYFQKSGIGCFYVPFTFCELRWDHKPEFFVPATASLVFRGRTVSKLDLQQATKLQSLDWLTIRSCEIEKSGYKYLAELHDLELVDIKECDFADEGLKCLLELPKLTVLTIVGCQVTEEAADRFKRSRPDVAFLWLAHTPEY